LHKEQTSSLDDVEHELKPLLADPAATVLFFDLDGTLAPIVGKPGDVAVPPQLVKLIRRLAQSYMAVVIVSGRQSTEARRIVGLDELAYVGNHGFELMLPGRPVLVSPEAQPHIAAIRELVKFCRALDDIDDIGIWLEDKTATISLHYRRSPDTEAARKYIKNTIAPKARELGLKVNEGRMVIEIKPPEKVNKGIAVRQLIDRLDAGQALYAGDDTTDIDALKELRRRRDNKQVMVGVGVVSNEMPKTLPRYADLLIGTMGGVENLLKILVGDEP
jgi:trehalose 6-phosphate phosphatase